MKRTESPMKSSWRRYKREEKEDNERQGIVGGRAVKEQLTL